MLPRRGIGIFAAAWMASFRSRPRSAGDDEVAGLPEGVIVGQALLDAGVRLLLGHRVHVVLDKIHQADVLHNAPAVGEWLRTPACRSEGAEIDSRDGYARQSADSAGDVSGCGSTQYRFTELCGEACALERRDAPIKIGAQLGREGGQGLERALDRRAVGG